VDGGPDTSMPPNPWKPAGLGSVRSLSGGSHQTCAAITDGSVQCWGVTPAAVTVEGLHRVTNLAVGFRHACALDADGLVSCWGDNDQSQLGEPSAIAASAQPVNVVGGATAIAAGGYFTCALVEQGRVTCWGDNFRGQLGATAASQTSAAPVQVQGISGATAIAAGGYFACAIVNGDVWCWGAAVDGSTSFSAIPTAVTGVGGGVTSIATGNGHVCALVDTGAVVCWGMNLDGELGGGSAGGPAGPTIVVGWP
jgi:alpha-tubulin suppressor-like RCC1 family protein